MKSVWLEKQSLGVSKNVLLGEEEEEGLEKKIESDIWRSFFLGQNKSGGTYVYTI